MPADGHMLQRPWYVWGIRSLMALAALIMGYFSIMQALSRAVLRVNPAQAYHYSSFDPAGAGLLSAALAVSAVNGKNRQDADSLARLALMGDATVVPAVTTLGINAQVRGDIEQARRLFGYSQRLSRRDLQTQLWAIEDSVGRGNVEGALHHYDIALRTSRSAPDMLFPVLNDTLTDPAIRSALTKTLAARPVWTESFINYVAGHAPDARSMAALFQGVRGAGGTVSPFAQSSAIHALLAAGQPDDAWRYYASLRPGADRRKSRDDRFMAASTAPLPFDWVPVNDGGILTSIQPGRTEGAFVFSAASGTGGVMLRQEQVLPPGRYQLTGYGMDVDAGNASPYWTLRCKDGRELGRIDVPNSSSPARSRFSGRFQIPAGCPVQTLALIAQPSDALGGVAGQIDQVQLGAVQ
ncbi:MAG: hypothetical protein EOO77_06915 [Oxalobacteraceae bacterium]|nr:MAG: hypothetical protein EOO77_06915 [Oxalobacteraceae bacterium]